MRASMQRGEGASPLLSQAWSVISSPLHSANLKNQGAELVGRRREEHPERAISFGKEKGLSCPDPDTYSQYTFYMQMCT